LINKLKIGYSGHSITKQPSERFLRSMNLSSDNLQDLEKSIQVEYEKSCPVLLII